MSSIIHSIFTTYTKKDEKYKYRNDTHMNIIMSRTHYWKYDSPSQCLCADLDFQNMDVSNCFNIYWGPDMIWTERKTQWRK